MSSPAPIEGKCGAATRGKPRGFCTRDPVPEQKRCRLHGGVVKPTITHGLHSNTLQMRYADPALRARLEQIQNDPHLLDARRAAAVSQLAVEYMPIEPLREDAARMARTMLRKKLGHDVEITDDMVEEEIPTMLHELRAIYAERVVINAGNHARTVGFAAKQEKVAEILMRGAVPIMRRFADRVAGLVKKYLPPSQQVAFLFDLRRIVEETSLEIVKFGEDADKLAK